MQHFKLCIRTNNNNHIVDICSYCSTKVGIFCVAMATNQVQVEIHVDKEHNIYFLIRNVISKEYTRNKMHTNPQLNIKKVYTNYLFFHLGIPFCLSLGFFQTIEQLIFIKIFMGCVVVCWPCSFNMFKIV